MEVIENENTWQMFHDFGHFLALLECSIWRPSQVPVLMRQEC